MLLLVAWLVDTLLRSPSDEASKERMRVLRLGQRRNLPVPTPAKPLTNLATVPDARWAYVTLSERAEAYEHGCVFDTQKGAGSLSHQFEIEMAFGFGIILN